MREIGDALRRAAEQAAQFIRSLIEENFQTILEVFYPRGQLVACDEGHTAPVLSLDMHFERQAHGAALEGNPGEPALGALKALLHAAVDDAVCEIRASAQVELVDL